MRLWHKRIVSIILAAILLLCTGCSLDVEQYLRPPKTRGEQQAVQLALESYIRTNGQNDFSYTLCYPVEGDHTAAFILCDKAGRPVSNEADEVVLAVAFYALEASEETHIHLLRCEQDTWVSVADVVGGSSAILQAAFGDLDGDGMAELVTGWDTYNSRDRRLDVFSLSKGLTRISGSRVYNRLFVGALTATGRDSLVLLRMETGSAYAGLTHVKDGALYTDGTVWLDSGIQQFTDLTLCPLSDGLFGLYVDAVKDTDTAITELIYVDDGQLYAPFCHQTRRLNTATARPVGFAMCDIDGDGRVDIPQCRMLDGYDIGEMMPDYAYRTDWRSWDVLAGKWLVTCSSILNVSNGYYISLDDSLRDTVTTVYEEETGLLTLVDAAIQQPLLRLRPVADNPEDAYIELFKADEDYGGCEVWFDDSRLDINAVREMVQRWEDETWRPY